MELKYYLLYLTIFLIIEALELLFHNYLFTQSVSIIQHLQASYSFHDLKVMKTMFNIMYSFPTFGASIIAITWFSYPAALYAFFVQFINAFATYFLKLVHQYPRPFYVSNQIYGIECQIQFGCPSGHMTIAASQLFTACLIMHKELDDNPNRKLIMGIFLPLVFIQLGATAFSRMILGMHSIDQVLFGTLFGILLSCFLFHLSYHKFTHQALEDIRTSKMQILLSFIPHIMMLVSTLIANSVYNEPEIWKQRILKNCPGSNVSTVLGIFGSSSIGYVWFGCILGLILDHRLVSSSLTSSHWNQTQFCCKGCARLGISLVGVLILEFIMFWTPSFHSMWLDYFFKQSTCSILIGMFVIGTVRKISQSCKLIRKERELYSPMDDEEVGMLPNKL